MDSLPISNSPLEGEGENELFYSRHTNQIGCNTEESDLRSQLGILLEMSQHTFTHIQHLELRKSLQKGLILLLLMVGGKGGRERDRRGERERERER